MNPIRTRQPSRFEERLLPVLLAAVEEHRRSTVRAARIPLRRSLAALAAAILAIAAGLLALQVLSDDPLRGALAIDREGDIIRVHVVDAAAAHEQMTRELRAAGLDARIETVPVTPDAEGRWWDVELDYNRLPPRVWRRIEQQVFEHERVLELPLDLKGEITLEVGRPASKGEFYINGGANAMAPGQPLHCLRLDRRDPPEADRLLRDMGYDVIWVFETSDPPISEPVEAPPDGVITWAWLRGPDVVDVQVAAADDLETQQARWTDFPDRAYEEGTWDWDESCPTNAGA